MPFGSYEASKEQAFMSASRVLKETGCGAIKLEGGRRMAETIRFLVERGVPVMGHIGLTPQSINTIGSFKAQGREEKDWGPIEEDARAVTDAGAFCMVIEAVAEPLARKITAAVDIPTIGIGASAGLRRPDPGAGGHARALGAGAEIREALWRPWPLDREGGGRLCRRGAFARLPGAWIRSMG